MIKLPAIFKDGCVLEKNARFWGVAAPNEVVNISFCDNKYTTTADTDGSFDVTLRGNVGGPYTLTVNNEIIINDIYIGICFFCGGQSNMELPVSRVRRAFEDEIAAADFPFIRAFLVEKNHVYAPSEHNPFGAGGWIKASGADINDFYAAAFFFAAKMYKKYKTPIGLICCAAGGSTVQSWLSPGAVSLYPDIMSEYNKWKSAGYAAKAEQAENADIGKWFAELDNTDPGFKNNWQCADYDALNWDTRELTKPWDAELCINGSVWFATCVDIPEDIASSAVLAEIHLGVVVDSNYIYINGIFIGRVEYRYPPSIFPIPQGVLKKGKNNVTVRVLSHNGPGGFVEGKEYKIKSGKTEINLNGIWKYRVGAVMPPCPPQTQFYLLPCGFYHGMLLPVIKYSFTAVLWYQGESNAGRDEDYKELMHTLINEFRALNGSNFPFIITQLAAYGGLSGGGSWAWLRGKQQECLDIPGVAMITAIDCGEYNDLHPLDKKTIGERFALCVQGFVYGETEAYKNPLAVQAGYNNGLITIDIQNGKFENARVTLEIETSTNGSFAVYGLIKNSSITIKCEKEWLKYAKYIRYAWSDCPIMQAYNEYGLPLLPFRIAVDTENC